MDFNATIDLIIKDLDEAREIIDDLKKYPGVPALQVELAKSKCKSAGEVIALLKSLRDNVPIVKEEPIKPLQQQLLHEENKTPAGSTYARLSRILDHQFREKKPNPQYLLTNSPICRTGSMNI